MDALRARTPEPAVTLSVVYDAPEPATARCSCHPQLPSSQECHLRALRDDLLRAADSAHWARFDAAEEMLRAMAERLR